jgi:hypothetical protein
LYKDIRCACRLQEELLNRAKQIYTENQLEYLKQNGKKSKFSDDSKISDLSKNKIQNVYDFEMTENPLEMTVCNPLEHGFLDAFAEMKIHKNKVSKRSITIRNIKLVMEFGEILPTMCKLY